ncbi:MAG: hypothetical protein ACR2NA_14010 [Solirubrobacterales bacterium]
MTGERCTWCDEAVELHDGWRAYEPAGARRAVFCRLEHIVPWQMRRAHWEAGERGDSAVTGHEPGPCAHCGDPVDPEIGVLLVRHRGEYRIPDDFCSVEHLAAWANAGGRWAP